MYTQQEADSLIKMAKNFVNQQTIVLPPGTDETYDPIGDDKHERFQFDLWRGTFRLTKVKYQTRSRKVIVLVRLDIDGSPHTNPDETRLTGTHLHIYREGFEDKWAIELDNMLFSNPTDLGQVYQDFCRYCNIADPPPFQGELL
jgi:hypothetical protein